MINRFTVPNLHDCTIHLANVASHKIQPELILKNACILSTYTNRFLENKEIWETLHQEALDESSKFSWENIAEEFEQFLDKLN